MGLKVVEDEQYLQPLEEPLTRREQEILELLAQGLTAPEMADRLTLAVSSIRWYLQQIYGKLGVPNRRQAINRAASLGLLHLQTGSLASPPAINFPASRQDEIFPTLPAAIQHPHNLPPDLTSFVGREQEIAWLKERFTDGNQHLITLTGSGGTGKTRLALQLGRAVLDFFPDGVWLVELAPLSDPRLVVGTLAQYLGVHQTPGIPLQETLANYLAKKHLLLILDNCEHLLQECSRLADFLLRRCPNLALLATSREFLNLAGENSYRVPSLSLPGPAQRDSAQIQHYEAVQLFLQRARQVVPDFSLDGNNAAAVSTICRRLDGVPLAIELAAARMRMLTAQQIATRLDNVFHLLTGGSRNMLPRQQTLKAAIDWSYALLSPLERLILQKLSVFARSWTIEAAEAVCAGDGITVSAVLDLLSGLVDKSLVQAYQPEYDQEQCNECYRMLETVRQYARDRLLESGGSEAMRDRHLSYYLKLGELANTEITGSKQLVWVNRLEGELENLRMALEWSLGTAGRVEDGLRLATSLMWFWHFHDRDAEGYRWLQNLLKAAGVTAPALAAAAERFHRQEEPDARGTASQLAWIRAISAAAHLSIFCPNKAAINQIAPLLDEGIALCRAIGEPASRELAWALIQKRTHLHSLWVDNERSDRGYQEILDICRWNGYRFEEAFCLYQMEKSYFNPQKCLDELSAALAIFESLGETDMTATAQVFLAFWLYPTGDYYHSRLLLQQGLAYLKKVGNITGWCRWIIWQFFLYPEPANARLADEALAYLQDHDHVPFTIGSFVVLAETEWGLGNYERAERVARQALAANQNAKSPYVASFTYLVLGRCAFSKGDLACAGAYYQKMTASWSSEPDMNLWLPKGSLDALAILLSATGKMDAAAKLFAAVDALYQVFLGWPLQRAINEHDAALAAARQALGEEVFAQTWQAGKAMSLVEAFEYGQRAIV